MPKEQLRLLAGDVERLLGAGSNVAVGDAGLQRRSKALRELSGRVPVLKQIADSVDQVTQAKPSDVGRKLLDLLLVVRQVRASLTTAGADGALTPIPPSGPWATKTSVHDVTVLRDALLGTGEAGFEDIKNGLERKVFYDLRLVQPILDGLAHSAYAPRSDLIAQQVIPSLGSAMLAELRQQFDGQGKSADARRLKAICKIAPEEGTALCRKTLAEGSKELKPVALELLAEMAPVEAEQTGLKLLAQKPEQHLRAAALRSLARSTKDEALEQLLLGVIDTPEVWNQAHEAMKSTPHPQATPRLVALLQEKLEAWQILQAKKEPKDSSSASTKGKTKVSTREKQLAEAKDEVHRVLLVLQSRRDPKAVAALVPHLQHKETNVRVWTVEALAATRAPEALAAIIPLLKDGKEAVWQAAIRACAFLPPAQHFDTLAPLAKKLYESKSMGPAVHAINTLLLNPAAPLADADDAFLEETSVASSPHSWDPRWGSLLTDLMGHYDKTNKASGGTKDLSRTGVYLPQALVKVMGQQALPHLLQVLPQAIQVRDGTVLEALSAFRDKAVAAAIVEQLAVIRGDWYVLYSFQNALGRIGDKSVLPRLREIRDALRDGEKQRAVDNIIALLDRLPDQAG